MQRFKIAAIIGLVSIIGIIVAKQMEHNRIERIQLKNKIANIDLIIDSVQKSKQIKDSIFMTKKETQLDSLKKERDTLLLKIVSEQMHY